ncbi:hypothetical protein EVAR_78951_1 [Eumeta japonica]|uniref:Uncharacterized protein n=1 Tax=Eumeta variegata TaxID=151549 RepID=A0A4C1UT99_EUMVA|nr:hypothetical protein EVAR_78951_1 [Eumeta japonica]
MSVVLEKLHYCHRWDRRVHFKHVAKSFTRLSLLVLQPIHIVFMIVVNNHHVKPMAPYGKSNKVDGTHRRYVRPKQYWNWREAVGGRRRLAPPLPSTSWYVPLQPNRISKPSHTFCHLTSDRMRDG